MHPALLRTITSKQSSLEPNSLLECNSPLFSFLKNKYVTHTAKLTLLVLLLLADSKGKVQISDTELANAISVSEKTISVAKQELKKRNMVDITRNPNAKPRPGLRATTYHLTFLEI